MVNGRRSAIEHCLEKLGAECEGFRILYLCHVGDEVIVL